MLGEGGKTNLVLPFGITINIWVIFMVRERGRQGLETKQMNETKEQLCEAARKGDAEKMKVSF